MEKLLKVAQEWHEHKRCDVCFKVSDEMIPDVDDLARDTHSRSYLRDLERLVAKQEREGIKLNLSKMFKLIFCCFQGSGWSMFDQDCYVCKDTLKASCVSCGCVLEATKFVIADSRAPSATPTLKRLSTSSDDLKENKNPQKIGFCTIIPEN